MATDHRWANPILRLCWISPLQHCPWSVRVFTDTRLFLSTLSRFWWKAEKGRCWACVGWSTEAADSVCTDSAARDVEKAGCLESVAAWANQDRFGPCLGGFDWPLLANAQSSAKVVSGRSTLHLITQVKGGFAVYTNVTSIGGSRDSLLVRAPTRDQKIASSNPGRSSGRMFFSRVNFVCWLLFGVRSTPVLPQWHVKDSGHSAKNAGGKLHLNTHTPEYTGR